ncbi:BnaA01g32980D [Brassica napus]|uniref:BnaA01g32980D protein n=1 Tax=Brassica napus TaxID=3708 RepID=A0A078HAH5_BRANA|nr:BnaA01g32980D [Brassica napus]
MFWTLFRWGLELYVAYCLRFSLRDVTELDLITGNVDRR